MPSLGGAQSPMYTGQFHNAFMDARALLSDWNAFLSSFSPRYITTADGERVEVFARTRYNDATAGSEWFTVSNTSTADTLKVRVSEGRIACPDLTGYSTATPAIAKFLRTLTVAAAELTVTATCGVYCKITVEELTDSAARDYAGEDTGGLVTVTVKMRNKIWRATAGEIIISPTAPADTDETSHVLLANVTVTDGAITILPRHRGLIFAPAVTLAYGADPTVETETESYTVCNTGTPVTVTFIAVPE